jgi:hypothetical protein
LVHKKNNKIQYINIYIYIYIYIFGRNPKNNRSEERMLECQKKTKLVEEVQKCKRLKFDGIFLTGESPVDKENSI